VAYLLFFLAGGWLLTAAAEAAGVAALSLLTSVVLFPETGRPLDLHASFS
jgi:hypothetical protein